MAEKKGSVSLFANNTVASAVNTAKSTLGIGRDDKGRLVVQFAFTEGKGMGKQSVPVEEFSGFIEALEEIAEDGINRTKVPVTSVEMLRNTVHIEEGRVFFRATQGKGAKPTSCPEDEFSDVVRFLQENQEKIMETAQQISDGTLKLG